MLRSEFLDQLRKSPDGLKYLGIIENAKKFPPEERGEVHHIYPKSLEEGRIDSEDNLVRLSVEDHLLCHYYLAKCFGIPSLCYAFRMMWDLHSDTIRESTTLRTLTAVAELRKRGRLKTPETLEKHRLCTLGRIQINRNGKERKIWPKELEKFEAEGWNRGRAIKVHNPSLGRIWVHQGTVEKCIETSELTRFEAEGWKRGRKSSSTKGKIRMSRNTKIRYATEETVHCLEQEGYRRGVKIPRYRVRKEGKIRYIQVQDLEKFLREGWERDHTFNANYQHYDG